MIRLLLTHWIADFVLQSSDMALRKSKEIKVLLAHAGINFGCFFIAFLSFGGEYLYLNALIGASINALLHGLIDWNLWRFYKKGKNPDFKYWEDHNFWVGLGFDQLLHGCIIAALYGWLV